MFLHVLSRREYPEQDRSSQSHYEDSCRLQRCRGRARSLKGCATAVVLLLLACRRSRRGNTRGMTTRRQQRWTGRGGGSERTSPMLEAVRFVGEEIMGLPRKQYEVRNWRRLAGDGFARSTRAISAKRDKRTTKRTASQSLRSTRSRISLWCAALLTELRALRRCLAVSRCGCCLAAERIGSCSGVTGSPLPRW